MHMFNQIETEEAAQDTPKADMEKRAAARADKKQKLKNPLFFISPHRLSVRNLSRTVTDATLKKLFVEAARTGLAKKKATEKVTVS
jgi:nucleolar protein 4